MQSDLGGFLAEPEHSFFALRGLGEVVVSDMAEATKEQQRRTGTDPVFSKKNNSSIG